MTSIPGHLITIYMRFRNIFMPPFRGVLDVRKERADTETLAQTFGKFSGVEKIPVSANGVPAEWIFPEGSHPKRTILYLHGGTFLAGSITSHRSLAASIALAAKARCLLIDYRLAPENPYPAGPDDVEIAYQWLLDNGTLAKNIAVAGDSAGGTLTIGLLQRLRDKKKTMPAVGVCLSPAFDLSFGGETWKTNKKSDVMLVYEKEKVGVSLYLNGKDARDPEVSPIFGELHGFPPILIQVGTAEVLLSDAVNFTEKAKTAGADVTLQKWDGMQHEWQFATSILPEARQAVQKIGEFVKNHIPETD